MTGQNLLTEFESKGPSFIETDSVHSDRPNQLLRKHLPELDSLRGVAILMVFFFHALWSHYGDIYGRLTKLEKIMVGASRTGWLGVHLFFVLSGFLITGILYESRTRQLYYRPFYAKRALRILPLFILLILTLLALRRVSPLFAGISILFLANLAHFFGRAIEYTPLWSLAVEEHFYLIWPTIIRCFNPRLLLVFLGSACVLAPLGRWLAFKAGFGDRELYFYSWFNFDCLAYGALTAVILRQSWATARFVKYLAIVSGLCGITLFLVFRTNGILTRTQLAGAVLQYPAAGLLFVSLLLTAMIGTVGNYWRIGSGRVLKFYGYISYGLYLIHTLVFEGIDRILISLGIAAKDLRPEIMILRFGLYVIFATGLAWLSRRYFEEYFLRRKQRVALMPAQV